MTRVLGLFCWGFRFIFRKECWTFNIQGNLNITSSLPHSLTCPPSSADTTTAVVTRAGTATFPLRVLLASIKDIIRVLACN